MIVENLDAELIEILPTAEVVVIAVALAKVEPFERIYNLIPSTAIKKILIGIDLPTEIEALEFLNLKKNGGTKLACGIYNESANFHPKVYLIKSNNQWVAYIGSANLTDGGLINNIELTYKIDNQNHCENINIWFNNLFKNAYPIDETNIEIYRRNKTKLHPTVKKAISKIELTKENDYSKLDHIDFSDRFFRKAHHLALRKELWLNNTKEATDEREETHDRLIELHEIIYPQFRGSGLIELSPNVVPNIVSRFYQINPSEPINLNRMWLSYGKSQEDIKKYQKEYSNETESQTFIHHARLQVMIELERIGIWLLFGKANQGSKIDRSFFRDNMRDSAYRLQFFNLIKALPTDYWIQVNGKTEDVLKFTDADELYEFCKKDNLDTYFIIGRDYNIIDKEMSAQNLPNTVLSEFNRLYQLYNLMKHQI